MEPGGGQAREAAAAGERRGLLRAVPEGRAARIVAGLGLGLVALVITINAWMCDDAYILLRYADNLVNGYGLRWNVAERVQAFTCPLWQLVLCVPYAVTREPYYTTLAVCIAVSVAAAAVILRAAARGAWGGWAAGFAAVAMATSKGFVDFSTSGLENSLSHLLLVLLLVTALRDADEAPSSRRTLRLSLLASLLMLNRMDLVLFAAPVVGAEVLRGRSVRHLAAAALGQAPLAAWLLFSLVYYGFFLPNTAYAKLAMDVPTAQVVRRGVFYLANAAASDPVSLAVAVVGLAAGVVCAVRTRRLMPTAAAVGVLAYLAYVVRVGGDFMSVRFVAAPFVAGLCLLVLTVGRRGPAEGHAGSGVWVWRAGMVAAAGIGLAMPMGPLKVPTGWNPQESYREIHRHRGTGDERLYYAQALALAWLVYDTGLVPPDFVRIRVALDRKREYPDGGVFIGHAIGMWGYYSGPLFHYIDVNALADPLLARLPPYYRNNFRPGHLTRMVPKGYMQTQRTGRNLLEDPDLARYYDHLLLITRGPIWSRERWRSIVAMQLGRLDGLIDPEKFREPPQPPWPRELPLPWHDPYPVPPAGDLADGDWRSSAGSEAEGL